MTLTNFPNGISIGDDLTLSSSEVTLPNTSIENLTATDVTLSGDLTLSDTVWDDLRVPVLSTKLGGTKDPDLGKVFDDGSGSQGVFSYLFSATTEEELYFMVQVPHGWKYETAIHPHVHWIPTVNGSAGQKVSWGLEYVVGAIGEVFGNTTIVYADTPYNDETLVANKHYLTEFPDISMTGIDSVSAMILCRVFRDATGAGGTDDYANDVALLEIDFHYESDRIGSDNEYS